jgi:hypothetical protein
MSSSRRCTLALTAFIFLWGADAAEAAPSGALHFSGNDWIEVRDTPGSALDITGSVTLEAWVRFQNYATCCWNTVAGKAFSHPTENVSYWMAFSNHSGENFVYGEFGQQQPAAVLSDATPIRDNTWHHLAIVLDDAADQTRLYIDGVLADTGVQTTPIPITDFSFYIANRPGHVPATFDGDIDEVRLWNIARTGAELLDTMSRELTGQENGLIGYWNFNEGSGEAVDDRSGNGNDGDFVGAPVWILDGPSLVQVSEPPGVALALSTMVLLLMHGQRTLATAARIKF